MNRRAMVGLGGVSLREATELREPPIGSRLRGLLHGTAGERGLGNALSLRAFRGDRGSVAGALQPPQKTFDGFPSFAVLDHQEPNFVDRVDHFRIVAAT